MKKTKIPFNETGLFSKLICDLSNKNIDINIDHNFNFDLNTIKASIKKNKKTNTSILRDVIKEQYQKTSFLHSNFQSVNKNIEILDASNTYTITTGHQLNLFASPLFLIYKIISTISYARYLNQNIDNCEFVPCFWMATEDHDFDEVNNFYLYRKEYKWQENTLDAVGNLSNKSILLVLNQIKDVFASTKNGEKLFNVYKKVYSDNNNYADATRALITFLFGDYGLVVVDGNHHKLKQFFVDDFKEEVRTQFTHSTVKETNNLLSEKYSPEINALKSNIFYLSDSKRIKINYDKGLFATHDNSCQWSQRELLKEIEMYPERFSPNVLLRPLYQERLMNNIIYVGGPSEISYWIQLVKMFRLREQCFPILTLRSHFLILSKKTGKIKDQLGLKDIDLFLDYNQQIKKALRSFQSVDTDQFNTEINQLFLKFEQRLTDIDNFPINSLDVFKKRTQREFQRLEGKILKFDKTKNSELVNQLIRINKKTHPNNMPHERAMSFIPYYIKYGKDFFDLLIRESSLFDNKYTILTEENQM